MCEVGSISTSSSCQKMRTSRGFLIAGQSRQCQRCTNGKRCGRCWTRSSFRCRTNCMGDDRNATVWTLKGLRKAEEWPGKPFTFPMDVDTAFDAVEPDVIGSVLLDNGAFCFFPVAVEGKSGFVLLSSAGDCAVWASPVRQGHATRRTAESCGLDPDCGWPSSISW